MGLGPVSDFLARVLEPPQPRAVTAALEVLRHVGALDTAPAPDTAAKTSTPTTTTGGTPSAASAAGGGGGGAGGANTQREVLSPLGRHLALLPVSPRLGKLLVLGALMGCLAPAATIAAAMSHK